MFYLTMSRLPWYSKGINNKSVLHFNCAWKLCQVSKCSLCALEIVNEYLELSLPINQIRIKVIYILLFLG